MGENTNGGKSSLLPDRSRQGHFFVCDIFDAAPKADIGSIEHPIFSVATRPDLKIRRYKNGSNLVEVTPSVKGLATVHDRDVLICCISQCIAALNDVRDISRTIRFRAYEQLKCGSSASLKEFPGSSQELWLKVRNIGIFPITAVNSMVYATC